MSPLVEKEESMYTRLPWSQACILWIGLMLLLLIDMLCISTKLAEMVYNKMENKVGIEIITIHQELKTPEVREQIMLEEQNWRKMLMKHC